MTLTQRIEDYALIGDCETAATVGANGSTDWLCWPAFDSDACFAAILGNRKNGRWLVAPAEDVTVTSRRYLGNTLILETRFETKGGAVALIDFMPPRGKASDVVRLVRGVSGTVKMRMELVIRFGFGVDIPWVRRCKDGSLLAVAGQDMTEEQTLQATRGENPLTADGIEMKADASMYQVMTYVNVQLDQNRPIEPDIAIQETQTFWRHCPRHCTRDGEY